MPLTAKELEMYRRYERNGGNVDWKALNRKFRFGIFGFADSAIDLSLFFEMSAIVEEIAEKDQFDCQLSVIVLCPIILTGEIMTRADFVRYRRVYKKIEVGKNIDHGTWKKARRPKRIKLAEEFFKFALASIPDRHLPIERRNILLGMIEQAVAKVKPVARRSEK